MTGVAAGILIFEPVPLWPSQMQEQVVPFIPSQPRRGDLRLGDSTAGP
jgi:hypothetical protein